MLYPIFIFKTADGYDGYFPDVEGCFFAGDSVEDAVRDAEVAFGKHVTVLTEQGGHVPGSRDADDYFGDERLVSDGGMLALVDIDPTKFETKAQKFNLTMPGNLLAAMDKYIEETGSKNRSAFIADLARREMARAPVKR